MLIVSPLIRYISRANLDFRKGWACCLTRRKFFSDTVHVCKYVFLWCLSVSVMRSWNSIDSGFRFIKRQSLSSLSPINHILWKVRFSSKFTKGKLIALYLDENSKKPSDFWRACRKQHSREEHSSKRVERIIFCCIFFKSF